MHLTRWPTRTAGGAAAAVAAFLPSSAAAHAFGQRYDLPIPLDLYLGGAGLAVALSFVAAAVALKRPSEDARLELDLTRRIPFLGPVAQAAFIVTRLIGLAVFLLVLIAGFIGVQDAFENIAPTTVWVIWWIGLAYASALIGDLWHALNPFRAVAAVLRRINPVPPLRYPDALGVLPALLLFAGFAWTEMVSERADSPAGLAWLALCYAIVTLAGMGLFGAATWLRNGEAFTVAFGLIARFGPFTARRRQESGERMQIVVRPFGAGLLSRAPVHPTLMLFVLLMLATVSFDGFRETPAWNWAINWAASSPFLRATLIDLRAAGVDLLALFSTAGLLGAFVVFVAVYALFARLMAWAGGDEVSTGLAARQFVLSLMPIAIAYHLAHYLSYFMLAGQLMIPLASDPFGFGWNLFGTASYRMDISVVSAKMVWYTAVTAIVIGHIAAVWLAHITALRVFSTPRRALASQYPMLVLMVGYTASSLWILAQPVVETGLAGG